MIDTMNNKKKNTMIQSLFELKWIVIWIALCINFQCIEGKNNGFLKIEQRNLQTTGPSFTGNFTLVTAGASSTASNSVISRGTFMNGASVNITSFFNEQLSLFVHFT